MAVRFYRDKNGNNVCEVTVHVCSKTNRSIRAQPSRKVFLKPGENKHHTAAKVEKDLRRQAIEEVARKEGATNSFGNLFSEWEDALDRKYGFSKQVTAETANDYCQAIRLYCQDIFNMPVDQVCRGDIRKIIDHMDTIGRSNSRKRAIINAINNMYNWAIDNGRLRGINASPATGIDVPRIRNSPPAILTPQQVREFLKTAREQCSEWFPVWLAAMLTGMRSGELWALRKRDVDLEGRLITVDKSYSRRRKTIKETKSGNWRKVPINDDLHLLLSRLSQNKRADDFVLPRIKKWERGEAARELRRFLIGIGLPAIRFHDLRACFATFMMSECRVAPLTVMTIGGWSELKTMQEYIRIAGVDIEGATDKLHVLPPPDAMAKVVNLFSLDTSGKPTDIHQPD
ncbi:MAG: site-specific integrase [Bdellovibrionaceae bacterium]|nr:site-specific integrase [Pseudobdellovibrionaceae bacterium]